jgi:hypothetical protein
MDDISTWSVARWTLFWPGHGVCDKYALAPAGMEAQTRGKGRWILSPLFHMQNHLIAFTNHCSGVRFAFFWQRQLTHYETQLSPAAGEA